MTTVLKLAEETRQKLLSAGSIQDRWSFLFTGIDAVVASLVVPTTSQRLGQGSVLEVGTERMRVISYTTATNTAAVVRGQFGTTATAHAVSAIVTVDPLFPIDLLISDLVREIRSWPPSLFTTTTEQVTIARNQRAAQLSVAAGVTPYRVVDAVVTDTTGGFTSITKGRLHLSRVPTTIFPSGWGLSLDPGVVASDAITVQVTYAHSFDVDPITATTDLETACSIPASMHDIIIFGVGVRAMAGKDVGRNELAGQGQQRFPSEVPPQSWAKSNSIWQEMRRTRMAEEEARLLNQYPWRQL